LSVGIVTATKFQGNTTGNVSGLADDTNINVGIITSTSFTGDLVGNAAGLSTTTANIKAGILSATSFAGNFTGVASGITGTPNIVVGIMTGTLKGDGSGLTGIAATNWISNNVTANSSTTTVDLALGNVVKFTQSASTTVSFANTGTSNIVTFIRTKDATSTERTLTWPSAIKWNNGSAPTLDQNNMSGDDFNVITLLTRDEGVTWYGWETMSDSTTTYQWWAWGDGEYGQWAQNQSGGPGTVSSPIQITGSWTGFNKGTASHANASGRNMMGSKADGTLWAWGRNASGNLGLNDNVSRSSPTQIPGTDWGECQVSLGTNNFVVKSNGTLWAMGGSNYAGGLGINLGGAANARRSSPTQIPGTTWKQAATGNSGSWAIKTDGTLWSWGYNVYGSLGQNDRTSRSSPTQIPGTTWDMIASGSYQAGAVKTDGTLWSWGKSNSGNLGHNDGSSLHISSPTQIPGTTWKSVSIDEYVTYAVKTDGTLWAWGSNTAGALGQNSGTGARSSPIQIPGTTWDQVANGGYYNGIATKTDGTIWTWGYNGGGALGHNNTTNYSSPKQIPGKTASFVATRYNGMMFFTEE
jgi:alpha-tubulin suppressor-like RCC1 family protein